jgi:hypothetical protein
MNQTYLDMDDQATAAAYSDGYALGKADRRRASDYSEAKFGVKFNEIKLQ